MQRSICLHLDNTSWSLTQVNTNSDSVFDPWLYLLLRLSVVAEVIVRKQRLTQFPLSAPHLCPKCLTLCFWQFAPIVQHFLIGGTLEDWDHSAAKECDIPF